MWLLYEMRYIPDNSLQRAFSYCVLLFVSTGFAGNPVRCIAMFGWRVATHYPMLLGSRMRDEAGAHNVAGSDAFGGVWCLLLLVLLCCVCGSTTGSLRVVCFAAYPVRSSPGLSLRMS